MIHHIKAEIMGYRMVSFFFLQLFFEFEYLNNNGIYKVEILFPYSSYPFRGNRVSDFSFSSSFSFYAKNRDTVCKDS